MRIKITHQPRSRPLADLFVFLRHVEKTIPAPVCPLHMVEREGEVWMERSEVIPILILYVPVSVIYNVGD